ncbi:MAG: Gfo/Idh/MocA family oxidoreductase [Candidatus Hydrogenedentes bacterium]|nr:Gfo/Idh/MocA family oxidoreductase [Candidatus Hydrogenedentota bacterium]
MNRLSRRSFLSATGGILATGAALSASRGASAAPLDRVRHAVVGLGGQGSSHAAAFNDVPDCEVVAVCDLDPARLEKAKGKLNPSGALKTYTDFRLLLEDKEIDTVSVATPDHWHTPVALAALAVGKHVYVEKPCSHNVREGILLAEAAARTGKCVQHGTQSRSGKGIQEAIAFLQSGALGKVRMAKAINHQLRGPIGRAAESDPPEGVDYDRWLGPAPVHRFTTNRWHYNWHWFWDYGTGDIGNDGIHQIDVARWGLGVGLPKVVTAAGGQLFYDDDHETPDTQIVTYEYDGCYLMFEMRLWTDYPLEGHDNGVVFYGDKGKLEVGRHGCDVTLIDGEKQHIGEGSDFRANVANFVECVKANDPSKLNAPIAEGAISAALCHLGNIATRVGRGLRFDAAKLECTGDDEANRLLTREYRAGYELPVVP